MADDAAPVVTTRHGSGGRILIVTMNRPQVCNAMDRAMYRRLIQVLEDAVRDDAIRSVVLTGAGKYFSSGRDLDDAIQGRQAAHDHFEHTMYREGGVAHFYGFLARYRKPLIAAVNGPGVGGGAVTAVLADVAIMSSTAYLVYPELQRGTIPIGASLALPRLIGRQAAMLILYTGGRCSAAEAERLGLIARAVEPEKVMETALAIAERVSEANPIAVRLFKTALQAGPWGCHQSEDIAREASEAIVESSAEYEKAWREAAEGAHRDYTALRKDE